MQNGRQGIDDDDAVVVQFEFFRPFDSFGDALCHFQRGKRLPAQIQEADFGNGCGKSAGSGDGKKPPERTIVEAARLAAFHSKAKNGSGVPVDFTAVKFVKKPAGARPGMVIFTDNKTLYVTPNEEEMNKLKYTEDNHGNEKRIK